MSLLAIENLSVSIHGQPILEDVSMAVEQGKILGVIGESGSGKSMTAFSVMQLLPHGTACSGKITLAGQDILASSEAELCRIRGRDVGMVFQEPMTALNPLKTIGAQVAETVLVHEKVSRQEALSRAAEALERAELPQDRFPLSRYPHELSGGQRQRVVIAMAIALRPKLLIADEPTTALDVTTQAQILKLLKKLVNEEERMGLMLISHDLAVVAGMAMTRSPSLRMARWWKPARQVKFSAPCAIPIRRDLFSASAHVPVRVRRPEPAQTPVLAGHGCGACLSADACAWLFVQNAAVSRSRTMSVLRFSGRREVSALSGNRDVENQPLPRAILGPGSAVRAGKIRLNRRPAVFLQCRRWSPSPSFAPGCRWCFRIPMVQFQSASSKVRIACYGAFSPHEKQPAGRGS
jgi:peptide/nickel transport system ATP-binding protein